MNHILLKILKSVGHCLMGLKNISKNPQSIPPCPVFHKRTDISAVQTNHKRMVRATREDGKSGH